QRRGQDPGLRDDRRWDVTADLAAAELTATELIAAYRAGELSPVEATEAALQRIRRHDPQVNAFCLVDADAALSSAKESEERWRRGEPAGSLDGVPISIKDILLTKGWPTLRGSRTVDPAGPWEVDGPHVARVREHGAVLLGKTTTPELGWKGVTDSPLTGVTRNPWDPTRTPAGSSGGIAPRGPSAFARAAIVWGPRRLCLGSDGRVTVRTRAGFTGTTAPRPTYCRVPHSPPRPLGTLAHVGPRTRTAADAALLLDVISGAD